MFAMARRSILHEAFEQFAPILTQNGTLTLSIFPRSIVGPWMDLEVAFTFGTPVPKKLTRPPALEISATPDAYSFDVWHLQCAIDPTATSPLRRAHIPVRMIIERNENERSSNAT